MKVGWCLLELTLWLLGQWWCLGGVGQASKVLEDGPEVFVKLL